MSEDFARRAIENFYGGLEFKRKRYRGLLGQPNDNDSSPAVSGRANHVWFLEDGNPSKARQILNNKVPSIPQLPVIVGQDTNNPGFEQVLDVDMAMLTRWQERAMVVEHHLTHELGSRDSAGARIDNDVVFVQKQQYLPLLMRAQTTPDMTMYVEGDFYQYGDQVNYWPGGSTKTFSAPVSTGYAAIELVCIDGATNSLVYVRSVDIPSAAPFESANIPTTPLGSIAVGAVWIPNGATTLKLLENAIDVRPWVRTIGGSVSGSPHTHQSSLDGGLLSSGLSITGDVLLQRASDDTIMSRHYAELGEWHSHGVTITGDVLITGGRLNLNSTEIYFNGDSLINTDVRMGRKVNNVTGVSGYGRKFRLSGGPSFGTYDSDNSDPLWMARANIAHNQTEWHINVGDDGVLEDAFAIGYTTPEGVWSPVHRFQMDGKVEGSPFGSMYIPGVDIVVIIGSANPVEVEDASQDGWAAGELNLITFPTGGNEHYLTITVAGKYEIDWNMSFHTDIGGGAAVHGGVMVGGVAIRDNGEAHRDVSNSNDDGNMGAPCIADLPNGNEEISLWVSNDQSQTVHVEHATVTVKQIG